MSPTPIRLQRPQTPPTRFLKALNGYRREIYIGWLGRSSQCGDLRLQERATALPGVNSTISQFAEGCVDNTLDPSFCAKAGTVVASCRTQFQMASSALCSGL